MPVLWALPSGISGALRPGYFKSADSGYEKYRTRNEKGIYQNFGEGAR